jgi:acetyl-CoA carboxylase beta subunit
LAIEGQFQGGGIGEVSGAKIAAALDLALEDTKSGQPVQVVLLLETGGVCLQEANLGLEVIVEINSSLIALRQHVPVVGVIARNDRLLWRRFHHRLALQLSDRNARSAARAERPGSD